jgi:hypothetical protein
VEFESSPDLSGIYYDLGKKSGDAQAYHSRQRNYYLYKNSATKCWSISNALQSKGMFAYAESQDSLPSNGAMTWKQFAQGSWNSRQVRLGPEGSAGRFFDGKTSPRQVKFELGTEAQSLSDEPWPAAYVVNCR